LQAEDLYHVRKHRRRLRPDELPPHVVAAGERASPLIRLHRLVALPFKQLRRRTMERLRGAGLLLPEGSK
jgi:hypothetical protein